MRRNGWLAASMGLLVFGASAAVTGTTVTSTDTVLSFRLRDETAPAGSMVQMKVLTTEVTPISGGRPRFAVAPGLAVAGVAMFAATGELAGAAVPESGGLTITYVTTEPFTGDYPLLVMSLRLGPELALGSRADVALDAASIWNLSGVNVASRTRTARVTVGGSLAVTDVVPAGGSFPAGTMVSVRGVGFDGTTRLRVNGDEIDALQVVSPNEIQFALPAETNMAGAQIRIDTSSSRVIYYAYLRALPAATSGRPLLSTVVPVFAGGARTAGTFGPIAAMDPAFQYAALAVQNPGLERADMLLELLAADGTLLQSSSRSLDSGYRLALEVSELFDGAPLPPGSSVRLTSSVPVQAFGMIVDERIRSITPRLLTAVTP